MDVIAKEATGWRKKGRGPPTSPPPEKMGILVSALKTRVKRRARKKWAEEWTETTHGRATLRLCRRGAAPPVLENNEYENRKDRPQTLRLQDQSQLEPALHLRALRTNVEHVLLVCPDLRELRDKWFGMTHRESDLRKYFSVPALAVKAAKFLLESRLLGQFREVVVADKDLRPIGTGDGTFKVKSPQGNALEGLSLVSNSQFPRARLCNGEP
ncbi:MAG: hypothetical protein Q9180_008357 [Flavoplaca navasiana]